MHIKDNYSLKKRLIIILALFSFKSYSQEIIKYAKSDLEIYLTKVCGENDCEITNIKVVKNGISIQEIKPSKNYDKTLSNEEIFIIEDMNFDGKLDFRLLEFLPAGPNIPFLYWIYNPNNKLFIKNKHYAEITSPDFDYKKKEIGSTWRNACCEHGRDVYELIKNTPRLKERFVIGHNSNKEEYYEHWKLINGELQLIEKEVGN